MIAFFLVVIFLQHLSNWSKQLAVEKHRWRRNFRGSFGLESLFMLLQGYVVERRVGGSGVVIGEFEELSLQRDMPQFPQVANVII